MKEYAVLCVVGLVACRESNEKNGAVIRDTLIIAGPPAVALSPPGANASRPHATSKAGATSLDAGASSAKGPGTTATGAVAGRSTSGTTLGRPAPHPAADSVRGIVSVVGTDRDRRVMVAPPGGGKRIEVTGPLARLIGHVAGADIAVVGTPTGNSLEATRFLIKTVDGASAIDGTLKTEGSALYIITADGARTRVLAPPPPLLGHDGARIWITGDPAHGVASFGFIDPPG